MRHNISTHTPARGVTSNPCGSSHLHYDFYSHAREGRDLPVEEYEMLYKDFYSHAREGRD